MPLTVGLTGGIASGKSTVCSQLAQLGAGIIDADIIAKVVCQPGFPAYQEIIEKFGSEIVMADGQLDRKALRNIIFNDAQAKVDLETIIHPKVREQLLAQLAKSTHRVTIIAVPLLIEAKMQSLFDRILVVTTSRSQQLARLLQRDGISEQLAKQMIGAQIDDEQRLHYADDIIDNNGDFNALTEQLEKLMKTYQKLAVNNQLTH